MVDINFIINGVININTSNIILCLKLSLYIINCFPKNIIIVKNNTDIAINKIFLIVLNGLLTLNKITNPVNPVNITTILLTLI